MVLHEIRKTVSENKYVPYKEFIQAGLVSYMIRFLDQDMVDDHYCQLEATQ